MSEKQDFAKSATLGVAGTQPKGLELSDVVFVRTERITPHPENTSLFREEDDQYFERLRDDVKERGILVPLILKADDTLLAGHNRLRVAQELGLKTVPAQYLEAKLTEQQEREFLIKDNLYRRQLGREEWLELYRKLFPNFDQRIEIKSVGRKPKESTEVMPQDDGISEEVKPLTAKEIAKATGQKERTVQHQLKKHRELTNGSSEAPREQKKKTALNTDRDADQRFSRAIDEIYVAINDPEFSTWITVESLARTLTKKYQANILNQDEDVVKSTFFAKEMEFIFTRLFNMLQHWEGIPTSSEQKSEVYSTLQKKLDRLQERLTIRQEVE